MEKILCMKTVVHLSQRFLPNDWSYPMEKNIVGAVYDLPTR